MISKVKEMLTRLAIENPGIQGKFKMSAGVVYRKQLIATGVNSYKTHPLMLQYGENEHKIHLHAEVDAIKNALRLITQEQLTQCSLYVVRVKRPTQQSKEWTYALAKPCLGCQRMITEFGIKEVLWTEG